MHFAELLATVAISLAFLVLLFVPLERVFPAKPGQKLLRPAWGTDLLFLLGQYLFWNAVVFGFIWHYRAWCDSIAPASLREFVAARPVWLQAVAMVLLSDMFAYWGHRLEHRLDFLWSFHSVHHSAEHLDWLAAHREHPLDTLYSAVWLNLPVFILGFPLEAIAALLAFRGMWAIFIHSNVRLPIGPCRVLLGAPELHHWHHARDRDAGNYGNLSPLMDVLWGTYLCPDHEPEAFGLRDGRRLTYWQHLMDPFLPQRASAALPAGPVAEPAEPGPVPVGQ